jgi:hypothetical protein
MKMIVVMDGNWQLAAGCWLLVIGHQLLTASDRPPNSYGPIILKIARLPGPDVEPALQMQAGAWFG